MKNQATWVDSGRLNKFTSYVRTTHLFGEGSIIYGINGSFKVRLQKQGKGGLEIIR
ncbi:MAG: hypothetical protein AABX51_01955 [Nanoarchaeota archaeon]